MKSLRIRKIEYLKGTEEMIDIETKNNHNFILENGALSHNSSRRSMSQEHVDFSSFLFIQRHQGVPAMISQQVITTTDVNIFRMADYFAFKKFGRVQFETTEQRRNPLLMFLKFLRPLRVEEVFFTDAGLDNPMFLTNPLPSFWSEELSTPGIKLSQDEAADYARKLWERGLNLKQISRMLKLKGVLWTPDDIEDFAELKKRNKR